MAKTKNPCEYNPVAKRAAYEDEVHAEADIIVGHNGKWRLCITCSCRPEFKRFKVRKMIKK